MNATGRRKVVIVMRERKGNALAFVQKSEAASVPMIAQHVAKGSTVYADDASGWNAPDAKFATKRITIRVLQRRRSGLYRCDGLAGE